MKSRITALLVLVFSLSLYGVAFAQWAGPTQAPTGGNVTAPVNVGTLYQLKNGLLGVNSFVVFGNTLLGGSAGSNAYLNFGATQGSGGYGFRDNAGIMQFRDIDDPAGTWYNVSSSTSSGGSGSGQWVTAADGTSIYYNGGNVGVGTATPAAPLDVSIPGSGGDIEMLAGTNGDPTINNTSTSNSLRIDSATPIMFYANGDDTSTCVTHHGVMTCTPNAPDMVFDTNGNDDGTGNDGLVVNNDVTADDFWTNGDIWSNNSSGGIGTDGGMIASKDINAGGNMHASAFLYSSDERLKTDIAPLTNNLSTVLALQPVSFYWKNPSKGTGPQIGFIAQQVQKVVPQLVYTDASTTLESVDYARVTPLLVGAVQELNQKITDQQQQIDSQQQEINTLQQQIEAIQNSK